MFTGSHSKLATAINTVNGWLDGQPHRGKLDMANLGQWIDLIARFRLSRDGESA